MPVVRTKSLSDDAVMAVANVLEELRSGEPQARVAERLIDAGWPGKIDQPLVSKYLRGMKPLHIEHAAVFERAYGKPRGWIYARAGLIDVAELAADLSLSEPAGSSGARRGRSTSPEESIAALRRAARRARPVDE